MTESARMDRDHWERVARVYERALDEEPARRAALVAEASGDDDAVRRDVESLLAQDAAVSPLDSSVWDAAAGLLDDAADLKPGTWLGPYRIDALIDAGGMGEVYRATDSRLDRAVAIKTLPAAFAHDPRFRERFEREARAIAALGHPHICALYDVGRERIAGATGDEPLDFLVLEFIEGETLAARLHRGAVPIAEALRYATQIADALAVAHRRGVVHRDLKPSNIMLARSGAKLLDFGLAKLEAPSHSSTTVTIDGEILGTFQYMAPEQVEGRSADARTDIFALGSVLFEMITGRKAFTGNSRAALIGAILKDEPPPPSRDQPLTSPALDHIVQRCLAKDPDERWQSAADLARELHWAAEHPERRTHRRVAVLMSMIGVPVVVVLAAVSAWLLLRGQPAPQRSYRLSVVLPEGANAIVIGPTSRFALSRDGQQLAFVASRPDGTFRLYVRALDRLDTREIAGTDGALLPFWSPDGRSVGFIADGKLKRVDLESGAVRTLAPGASRVPAAWGQDDVILFTSNQASGLSRISASGGEPRPVTHVDTRSNEVAHVAPTFLPDGHRFLYLALTRMPSGRSVAAGTYASDLNSSAPAKLILENGSNVAYARGHLLFARESTLMAQPFDVDHLQLQGEPTPVAEHVTRGGYFAFGQGLAFSVSNEGTLAYQAGEPTVELTWFDRRGKKLGVVGDPLPPDAFSDVELTRDEKQAIVTAIDSRTQAISIWRYENERPLKTRLTFEQVDDVSPVVSPDANRLLYASRRRGPFDLYVRPVIGGGTEDVLFADQRDKYPMGWSHDGRFTLFIVSPPGELWALPMVGTRTPIPIVRGPFAVQSAQLSQDGRWLAYASTETGRSEIYVTEFPTPRTKRPISTSGGSHPRWREDGKEIFFRSSGMLMSAPVSPRSDGIELGVPQPLFDIRQAIQAGGASRFFYDVSADGERFLVGTRALVGERSLERGEAAGSIEVIVNWPALLRNKS